MKIFDFSKHGDDERFERIAKESPGEFNCRDVWDSPLLSEDLIFAIEDIFGK